MKIIRLTILSQFILIPLFINAQYDKYIDPGMCDHLKTDRDKNIAYGYDPSFSWCDQPEKTSYTECLCSVTKHNNKRKKQKAAFVKKNNNQIQNLNLDRQKATDLASSGNYEQALSELESILNRAQSLEIDYEGNYRDAKNKQIRYTKDAIQGVKNDMERAEAKANEKNIKLSVPDNDNSHQNTNEINGKDNYNNNEKEGEKEKNNKTEKYEEDSFISREKQKAKERMKEIEAEQNINNKKKIRLSREELARINKQMAYNKRVKELESTGITSHQAHQMTQNEAKIDMYDEMGDAVVKAGQAILNSYWEKREREEQEHYAKVRQIKNYRENLNEFAIDIRLANKEKYEILKKELPIYTETSDNIEDIKQEILYLAEIRFNDKNSTRYSVNPNYYILNKQGWVIYETELIDAYFEGTILYIKTIERSKKASYDKDHLNTRSRSPSPSKYKLIVVKEYDLCNGETTIKKRVEYKNGASLPAKRFLDRDEFSKKIKRIDNTRYLVTTRLKLNSPLITNYRSPIVKKLNTLQKLFNENKKNILKNLNEKDVWDNAKLNNSIEAYNQYLCLYPEGKYSSEAKDGIYQIKASDLFKKAETSNNIKYYAEYYDKYKKGNDYEKAKNKILNQIALQANSAYYNKNWATAKKNYKLYKEINNNYLPYYLSNRLDKAEKLASQTSTFFISANIDKYTYGLRAGLLQKDRLGYYGSIKSRTYGFIKNMSTGTQIEFPEGVGILQEEVDRYGAQIWKQRYTLQLNDFNYYTVQVLGGVTYKIIYPLWINTGIGYGYFSRYQNMTVENYVREGNDYNWKYKENYYVENSYYKYSSLQFEIGLNLVLWDILKIHYGFSTGHGDFYQYFGIGVGGPTY